MTTLVAPSLDHHETFYQVRHVVGDALQLGGRTSDLKPQTALIGNIPELDSMAVLSVITALEDYFQFQVADDDDMSEAFATLDSLTAYVEEKLAS